MSKGSQGNYTPEFVKDHNSKMFKLYEIGYMNQQLPMDKRPFKTADGLKKAMMDYLSLMVELEIFPTEAGFIIYLGCSPSTYYGILMTESDPRAGVLELFRCCISEHINQAGLSSASNTLFTIFYLKSKMGQTDQLTDGGTNLNINIHSPIMEFRGGETEYRAMIEETPKIQYLPNQPEAKVIQENPELSSKEIIKTAREHDRKYFPELRLVDLESAEKG